MKRGRSQRNGSGVTVSPDGKVARWLGQFLDQNQDSDVVIVDIDENSLGKFGQFPWNRKVFAKIIDQLNTSSPKAIGFDIFFTEKD